MAGKPGMKGGGGKRQGAGRKKKLPVLIADPVKTEPSKAAIPADSVALVAEVESDEPDSIRLLRQVTNDSTLDAKLRLNAAKALAPFEAQKKGEGGKKEWRSAAAKKATGGKFSPAAPPKLVAAGGKKV